MCDSQFFFRVPASYDGFRLDMCVTSCVTCCTRSYSASLAKNGDIYVNGINKKASYKVSKGELILGTVRIKKSLHHNLIAESIPLKVVYEDSSILVINKPAGIVVHPAPGHSSGTVVNAVMYHCSDLENVSGTVRPGIVHRLDKDTSGLLVIAKNVKSLLNISSQFKHRVVTKQYVSIVHGAPVSSQGRITFPIGRHKINRKKMSIRSRKSRPAETLWKVVEEFGEVAVVSLLKLRIITGRTHQIRVHCNAMGHPIVGDPLYGSARGYKKKLLRVDRDMFQLVSKPKRQMLHAYKMEFRHPKSRKYLTFEAELPDDMTELLDRLRSQ